MTNAAPVSFGTIAVGDGAPPVVLAEIGALFNRDVVMAERLVMRIAEIAKDSPLPVVLKGEILHDAGICLDDDSAENYQSNAGERHTERFRDLIERKVLSFDDYGRIFACCRKASLAVSMSVYDTAGADFAVAQGVVAIKIASSNITHLPLIRHCAKARVPLVIDSGRASLGDIEHAFNAARDAGAKGIVLEHSPDGHPAPAENHNLRTLQTLASTFGVPVGLSDHAVGHEMAIAAVALGASVIERNIVEREGAVEQDHAFASGIDRLAELVQALHRVWLGLGAPFRDLRNTRGLIATSARMGLVTRRSVSAGEKISDDTVSFAFPRKGIGVEHFDMVAGWQFIHPLKAGSPIGWQDVHAL